MRKYDRAFFYLEINRNSGNINQLMELVNAVSNAGDIRAFFFIDKYLRTVEKNFADETHLPENIANFVAFLKRRHAYCLINFGKFDEAEMELKELLKDPVSNDYALSELAYIQRIRSKESSTDDANDTSNATSEDTGDAIADNQQPQQV